MDNKKATLALGTEPVGKLLVQYATPAIVAMMASSLYNTVDSIFIGQGVGAMAISGLAITFPFMNLSAAFGAAIGVGASTTLSVRLGQRDYKTAQQILGNTVVLNTVIGILFGAVCLLFLHPILRFFGATDNTLPYASEYMTVILLGNVITHQYFGLNALLRAASKPRMAMYATIFTVMLNTALDPLFIYVFDMGIRGAAVAGMSPFSMNACSCIVVILINTALVRHGGDMAVGAYGIANRIGFLFFMVIMGINQGMQPIVGYNYGALKLDRVMRALKLASIAATLVMTAGWLVGELVPYPCARLFTSDEGLLAINFFQSIGKAKVSMFLSLSRQMIFLLPLLIVLPPMMGVDGVWWSLPASDTISFFVTLAILIRYMREFKGRVKVS